MNSKSVSATLTDREKGEIARHYARLKLAPPGLEAKRAALRRYRQCRGGDIAGGGGWDDPDDFSWWQPAFDVLRPPDDSAQRPS